VTAEHLYDPVRGKAVRALPEERVRRQLVDWLIASAGVPARLVAVEFPLSRLDPLSRKRADVVVWRPEAGVGLSPWLLAECKAPGVPIGDRVADQVRGYAARVRAEYVLVTNGADTRVFRLEGDRYEPFAGLPAFPRAAGTGGGGAERPSP
jgi:hypothetical protein